MEFNQKIFILFYFEKADKSKKKNIPLFFSASSYHISLFSLLIFLLFFFSTMALVTVLTPPDVYGIVEPGVYRSNFWQPANFLFIKQLQLKSLVILSPEKPLRPIVDFCEENGINIVCIYIGEMDQLRYIY